MPGYIHSAESRCFNYKSPYSKGIHYASSYSDGTYAKNIFTIKDLYTDAKNLAKWATIDPGAFYNSVGKSPFGNTLKSLTSTTAGQVSTLFQKQTINTSRNNIASLSVWIKPITVGDFCILWGWARASTSVGLAVISEATGGDKFTVFVDTYSNNIQYSIPTLGEWYHLAASFNSSLASDNLKFWINGSLVGTRTDTTDITYGADSYPFTNRFISSLSAIDSEIVRGIYWTDIALNHNDVQNLYQNQNADVFKHISAVPMLAPSVPAPLSGIPNFVGNLRGNLTGGFNS